MKKSPLLLFTFTISFFTSFCSAQYTDIVNFNGTATAEGANPLGSLTLAANKFYGMTNAGALNNNGNIFSVSMDGSNYKNLWNFHRIADSNGANPSGNVLVLGSRLYGMTYNGGKNNQGNIFYIDTNGSGYKDVWDFHENSDTNGGFPQGSLLLAGGKFYGMTQHGGINDQGNIFSIDTNGQDYKNLWSFSLNHDSNGATPIASLIISGNKLYGMTTGGGVNDQGNIFSIDTNGQGYKNLWSFHGNMDSNGANPQGSLLLLGNKLYGTTYAGGINNTGNIFSIDTTGNSYKNLWNFNVGGDSNGSGPYADLELWKGKLYGTTAVGGANFQGNLFSIDTDGSSYHDLLDFTAFANTLGQNPSCNLIFNGDAIYGTTENGGTTNNGSVFYFNNIPKVTIAATNIYCNGDNNGSATANVSGGTTPYTYAWTGGQTTATATGLSTGTYTVTVTDNLDSAAVVNIVITQPAALTASGSFTNVTCHGDNNGIASFTATGGTTPYTYTWTDGQTTATATGLAPGTYTATVKDACGTPTLLSTVTITQPTTLSNTINSAIDSGTCDGAVWVSANGGTTPYTYTWLPNVTTTDSAYNLCGANNSYCCIITDANGCTQSSCVTLQTLGINTISNTAGAINIYPNPSNGVFTVQSSVVSRQSSVGVYNVLGEQVYSQPIVNSSSFIVNLSNQPNGIYLYRVIESNGNLVGQGKMVIEK